MEYIFSYYKYCTQLLSYIKVFLIKVLDACIVCYPVTYLLHIVTHIQPCGYVEKNLLKAKSLILLHIFTKIDHLLN